VFISVLFVTMSASDRLERVLLEMTCSVLMVMLIPACTHLYSCICLQIKHSTEQHVDAVFCCRMPAVLCLHLCVFHHLTNSVSLRSQFCRARWLRNNWRNRKNDLLVDNRKGTSWVESVTVTVWGNDFASGIQWRAFEDCWSRELSYL